jgi:hypothetical protein
MDWETGLMTGNNRGVSTTPDLVLSLPILPSKAFSRISKDKRAPYTGTVGSEYKNRL